MNDKMTLQEIIENKDEFLEKYDLKEAFQKCGYSWDELIEIGKDFDSKRDGEYKALIQEYIAKIATFENVHSYRYRIKRTDSLLAKIIKKGAEKERKIRKDNYFREITDLLGIRILYIFKEDYLSVHKQIMNEYENQLVENVHLKLRDGDDEKTYEKMLKLQDIKIERNKVYRSIHYTINSRLNQIDKCPKLEIQTRTIFEEGWSEINHKLVYKKKTSNDDYLERTSRVLSELVGSCDAIGGLMKFVYDGNSIVSSDSTDDNKCSVGDLLVRFLTQ